MNAVFQARIEAETLAEAKAVMERFGTTPQEAVRMFLAAIARTGSLPLDLSTEARPDNLLDIPRRNRIWKELDDAEGW